MKRIKVITSHAGHYRFLAACEGDEPVGEIRRHREIPSPYAYSSSHGVWRYNGQPVIIVETSHKRFEVFAVDETVLPVGTIDGEVTA